MAEFIPRNKALSISPLKVSQSVGASLLFLGLRGAVPLMHGSQGCTAFGKVFFVRHFREPIPLQTTAMDHIAAIMGADDNIVEALLTLCERSAPRIIGLVSTGLSEAQGCDLRGSIRKFRRLYSQFSDVKIVAVDTPDFAGSFETGYAHALLALLDELVPKQTAPQETSLRVVNVLASSLLTPGDLEEIEELLAEFGLEGRFVPHVGESLGGELADSDFSPVTIGGTEVEAVEKMGDAIASLVIGPSLIHCGELLEQKTKVRSYYFGHLHSLRAVDEFVKTLLCLSGRSRPTQKVQRHRRQLADAMLDTHFTLGRRRFAVAGECDLLLAVTDLVQSMGGEVVSAVAPSRGEALAQIPIENVQLGDLEDLERSAQEQGAQLIFGSSHAMETSRRLGLPLCRIGFPLYDKIGAYAKRWVGYRGVREALFDLANVLHQEALDEVPAYRAELSLKRDEAELGEARQVPVG